MSNERDFFIISILTDDEIAAKIAEGWTLESKDANNKVKMTKPYISPFGGV